MRHQERIAIALQCRDCDSIPKVDGAGGLFMTPEGVEYQLMHNGVRIVRDSYHEFVTEIIKGLKGHHEPQEEKIFHEVIRHVGDGAVMIELGSFWAYYSAWFHQEIAGAVNYMIEPNPAKLEIGRANFRLNGFADGRFLQGFVGTDHLSEAVFEDWDGKKYVMTKWSVDDFLAREEIARVAILHSDIQGAELEMLHGATRSLTARTIDHLFISTHGAKVHDDCREFLETFGYRILAAHSGEESYSGDGLIVASAVLAPEDMASSISLRGRRSTASAATWPSSVLEKIGRLLRRFKTGNR